MAGNAKKRKRSANVAMGREALLPLPHAKAQMLSLRLHMALVALEGQHGSREAAEELLKMVYEVYLMSDITNTDVSLAMISQAASAINVCMSRGDAPSVWVLTPDESLPVRSVLALHDAMIAYFPLRVLQGARMRLLQALEKSLSATAIHETV